MSTLGGARQKIQRIGGCTDAIYTLPQDAYTSKATYNTPLEWIVDLAGARSAMTPT